MPSDRSCSCFLSPSFLGAVEPRAQSSETDVARTCDCGCPTVELKVPGSASRSEVRLTERLAPYEGRVVPLSEEPDGGFILFVDDERLRSLEYVSPANRSPTRWPSMDRIDVVSRNTRAFAPRISPPSSQLVAELVLSDSHGPVNGPMAQEARGPTRDHDPAEGPSLTT